ncbi:MAG: ComEC/Rec2 family competence protein, partial [Planctomycetota bacterium]|nr:ComEC/Rec2 family competence protein [Planctomycetota bacterium]
MGARAWTSAAAWICLLGAGCRLAAPEGLAAMRPALEGGALAGALGALFAAWSGRLRWAIAAILGAAALHGAARLPAPAPSCRFESRPVAVDAILRAWTASRNGWIRASLEVRDASAWGCGTRWHAEGRWESSAPPVAGDRLRVEGLLSGSAERPWLSLARLRVHGLRATRPLDALRQFLRERLDARLPLAAAGIARALLLADWEGLPDDLRESYRRLGLLHLLAVSGLHFWLWDALLRRLPATRALLVRWPALLLLGGLAGAGPAVVRAWVALLLRDAAARSGRSMAGGRLWSAALLLECALGAPSRQGLGFVLSYSATGCLLAAPPPRLSPGWAKALHASAAATCGSLPMLHTMRGTLEPWSVIASPLCALALPPRLLCALLALLPGGSGPAALGFAGLAAVENALLALLDQFPGTPLARPELPTARVLIAVIAGLLALRARSHGRKMLARWGGAASLALLLLPARTSDPGGLLLLPVGHGLGVVVRGAQETLLYDLGSRGRDPADLIDRVALPELARLGWPAPKLAALSHADADHAAGLRLLGARSGLRRLQAAPGAELRLEGLFPYSIRVIGTRAAVAGVSNAEGPVLELRCHAGHGAPERVVVLGDQFGYALRELRGRLDPGPIALLVLPHHGRTTDGLGELLDHLQPREAWAS